MDDAKEIIRIEIISESAIGSFTHSDLKLFFCLEGEMQILCGGRESHLLKEGLMVVNAREKHSWVLKKHSFGAVFYISSIYISRITASPALRFQCDSSRLPDHDYAQLRENLRRILAVYNFHRWQEKILKEQYFRMLISTLLRNYAIWESEGVYLDDTERTQMIVDFIQNNYYRQIGLQDLADQLHLTVPYLSKYIKQNLKVGFLDYLNSIRLSHTIDDLNLTDHSMTRVAFDNGFSSLTSFNRVFKEALGITPTEYRRKNDRSHKPDIQKKSIVSRNLLKKYLDENPIGVEQEWFHTQVQCLADAESSFLSGQSWKRVWNLGSAEELLRADVQEHILLMKKELGMKKVRIWGLFSEEMLIHLERDGNFNFSKLDQVFDFLVNHQLTPFLDLGFHPRELYRGAELLIYKEKVSGYSNQERYRELMQTFVRHYIKRYGAEWMENWTFEFSKDDRIVLHGGDTFFELFETVSACIKKYLPNAKVGGGGIFLYDELEIFEEFISGWKKRELHPDFVSVYLYPYDLYGEDGVHKDLRISGRPDYFYEKLDKAVQIMNRHCTGNIPLYVTQYDLTLSCRNFLNESCYRGTYLLKNIVACMDKAEVLSVHGSTDLLCEFYDSTTPLYGGFGLITKDGIKKPAFYALEFLNRMGKYILAKGEEYLIARDDYGNYDVLLFHCCRMESGYYLRKDDEVAAGEVERLYEKESLEFQVRIENIQEGDYLIKKNSLGTGYGNVLKEWEKLDYKQILDQVEVRYLKSICVPRLQYERMQITKGVLTFQSKLMANEMQLVQIRRIVD